MLVLIDHLWYTQKIWQYIQVNKPTKPQLSARSTAKCDGKMSSKEMDKKM